ncbi:MAG TPA: PIN domain-containing protein, partial [Acidobacteriaceae bacterium]|nr:PIN domain-containing protein [Acidobacteriaceae bacterium]
PVLRPTPPSPALPEQPAEESILPQLQATAAHLNRPESKLTRKIARPLPRRAAREIVDDFSIWCVDTSPADLALAFRIEDQAKISFWDALICASALKSGAAVILSEDLNPGRKIAGIKVENPFSNSGNIP